MSPRYSQHADRFCNFCPLKNFLVCSLLFQGSRSCLAVGRTPRCAQLTDQYVGNSRPFKVQRPWQPHLQRDELRITHKVIRPRAQATDRLHLTNVSVRVSLILSVYSLIGVVFSGPHSRVAGCCKTSRCGNAARQYYASQGLKIDRYTDPPTLRRQATLGL